MSCTFKYINSVICLTLIRSYEEQFKEQGIWYEHRLIDDMVGQTRIFSSTTLNTFLHLQAITNQ